MSVTFTFKQKFLVTILKRDGGWATSDANSGKKTVLSCHTWRFNKDSCVGGQLINNYTGRPISQKKNAHISACKPTRLRYYCLTCQCLHRLHGLPIWAYFSPALLPAPSSLLLSSQCCLQLLCKACGQKSWLLCSHTSH